eukprot:10038203-Alexandrium_andersonii.AAC.1
MMRADQYLDQTEEHDIRLMRRDDHWKLAIRMLHRISKKQMRVGINVSDPRWVLTGMDMPQELFDDMAALVVDPWEIPNMRNDLTRGIRHPRDAEAKRLEEKAKRNVENLQNVLETVLAFVGRKEQEAAQASAEPAKAGAGHPAWANYSKTSKTQGDKLKLLLDTPMPDDIGQRMKLYRGNGLIRGRSEEPKRGRGEPSAGGEGDHQTTGVSLAPAGADPALAAVHAGSLTLQPGAAASSKVPGVASCKYRDIRLQEAPKPAQAAPAPAQKAPAPEPDAPMPVQQWRQQQQRQQDPIDWEVERRMLDENMAQRMADVQLIEHPMYEIKR